MGGVSYKVGRIDYSVWDECGGGWDCGGTSGGGKNERRRKEERKKEKKIKIGRERKVEQGWDQQIDTCMESQKMKGKK
jgi:hypothetical protein